MDVETSDGDNGNFIVMFNQVQFQNETSNEQNGSLKIFLDTGSTLETFKDRELLTNIHAVKDGITVLTNGGAISCNQKGYFCGMPVWFHPSGLANIVSMKTNTEIS